MSIEIRFCARPDGVRVAYALLGDGPPIVSVYPWNHVEFAWKSPAMRYYGERLASHHTVVQFDRHGTGLSDRDRTDFSLSADVLDIEALADHLELRRFALHGIGVGGAVALAYAARHSERLSELILERTYARGEMLAPPAVRDAILSMIDAHWGSASRHLAALMVPHGSPELVEFFARFNRESVSALTARRILQAGYEHDLRDLARDLHVRTLVINWKRDPFTPFEAGRELAALIEGARFVPLEGVPHQNTEYGEESIALIAEFLGDPPAVASDAAPITVLVTDRESSTALTHQLGDEQAHELQRVHDRIVRHALRAHAGIEVKHLGDGIMATFTSPSAAIACAIDVQRSLGEHAVGVRVGLAAGEVVAEEGDIFGSTVQLASRLCSRARPGQIIVPEAVRQMAGVKGFKFGDVRSVALKGFPERVRIYELDWSEA